jgi:hypothetical protein
VDYVPEKNALNGRGGKKKKGGETINLLFGRDAVGEYGSSRRNKQPYTRDEALELI